MTMLNNYDSETFEYLNTTEAQRDPLTLDGFFTDRPFSTLKPVPSTGTNEVAIFNESIDDWEIKADFRDQTYINLSDETEHYFPIGVTPPAIGANEVVGFDGVNYVATPDYRDTTYYKKTDGAIVVFKLGDAPDSTMQLTIPAAILFARAKEAKRNEVRAAFNIDTLKPVQVGSAFFNGGIESATKLDGAMRLSERANLTTVTFTDIDDIEHILTLAEALTVVLTVGQDYQVKFMKKQSRMRDINNVVDEAALSLIVY